MGRQKNFIAFDLGANSGRAVLGEFTDGTLNTKEIHRFPNDPVDILGTMHWDVLRLFREIKLALKNYSSKNRLSPDSIGVDTWGVDFGLLDEKERLIENPVHYRDDRTDGILSQAISISSEREIFQNTGIQFMELNTLYQLFAIKNSHPAQLKRTKSLLMMADLFNYFLTGKKQSEFTLATTTQLYNPIEEEWSGKLLDRFDLPEDIMPPVISTGTQIGRLTKGIQSETGMENVPVIATATHDTASAVSAIPAETDSWAFISSGTWSLMGKEINEPLINGEVMETNFTNEGCRTGKFTLHKNLTGLWIIQECKKEWEKGGSGTYSYEEITQSARQSEAFPAIIDTQAEVFTRPGDMPKKVRTFCRKTDQPVPGGRGEITRIVLEGLALNYKFTLEQLERTTGESIDTIHIVGGGAKNELLSQFCSDATDAKVIAGPAEATAAGNIINQAIALGHLDSISDGRTYIRNSFELKVFEPEYTRRWDSAYEKFMEIKNASEDISSLT